MRRSLRFLKLKHIGCVFVSGTIRIEKIIKYCKNPPDNFNIKMEES